MSVAIARGGLSGTDKGVGNMRKSVGNIVLIITGLLVLLTGCAGGADPKVDSVGSSGEHPVITMNAAPYRNMSAFCSVE